MEAPRHVHYDTSRRADLRHVIETGMVWRSGERAIRDAIEAIRSGAVARPANLPDWAAQAIDSSHPV